MNLAHRQPFGEGNSPSESEAHLAGRSFHRMMDDLFSGTPETREDADNHLLQRGLDLKIDIEDHPGIKARLYHQTSLGSGEYIERVGLYEHGDTDEDWGPKICDYVSGSGDQTARRYDAPNVEARKIADSIELGDDNELDELKTAFDGLNLEIAMGLNGAPVGVEEVSGLRDLLATGTPLPYDNPEN